METSLSTGIDIGGTKVSLALVDVKGRIYDSRRLDVQPVETPDSLIARISQAIKELWERNDLSVNKIKSIGVGVPGTVDPENGLVEYCPNLGWEDIPAGVIFHNTLGREVVISQDSRAAAWAEYLLGAGRGTRSMACVTIGTGIGCGIVMNGKIFNGAMNTAGELGHTIYSRNGKQCNCGLRGCLERYCSGTGIFERAYECAPDLFKNLSHKTETVFELARSNNKKMLEVIHDAVVDLSIGIANMVSILSPEMIVISGGLCEHEDLIINPLRELVYANGYHSWSRKKQLKIEKAELGPYAPVIGAGLLYLNR